jgi:hypothetical protein
VPTTQEFNGLCACGCGEKTKLAPRNHSALGWIKGEPFEYVSQHQGNKKRKDYVEQDCGFDTPCHVWQGQPSQRYPSVKIKGKPKKVHIWFWEQRWGSVPNGLVVHHRCDNPRCCNIEHLGIVTSAVNTQLGPRTKLNPDKVEVLRRLYATGSYTFQRLGELYSVSPSAVQQAVAGKTYKKWDEHRPAQPPRRKDD